MIFSPPPSLFLSGGCVMCACVCLIFRFYRRRKTLCIIHLVHIFVLVFAPLASSLFFLFFFSFGWWIFTLFKLFSEWSPLLIFKWIFFFGSLQTIPIHITMHRTHNFPSNFDPTFKVVPLKYMLIFFDLPPLCMHTHINGHLPNHHHLHSNWIFACYNFLQYTPYIYLYSFLFGWALSAAAHLIWFLFVIYFCVLVKTFIFLSGRLCVMAKVNKFPTTKKFFFPSNVTCPSMQYTLTLLFLTVGKSFINHFPCVCSLYSLFRCSVLFC